MTAPPRMCAVEGMSKRTSLTELDGHPPIFFATRRAMSLAIGMYDGLRLSPLVEGAEARRERKGQNHCRRRTRRRSLSVTCMTSSRMVRCAQPRGMSDLRKSPGRTTELTRNRNGRGMPGPPSVSGLASSPMKSDPRG